MGADGGTTRLWGAAPGRDIIVVAASAGGLMPLRDLLAGLPADLPASVLIVLHIPATGGHALPGILDRSTPLTSASWPPEWSRTACRASWAPTVRRKAAYASRGDVPRPEAGFR